MVDSIPFAMKYTSLIRSSPTYSQLLGRTAITYMHAKLTSSSLSWSDDLRVAFSLRLNANGVMEALQHVLRLGEREYRLSEGMIATDASNYPQGHVLRDIFRLGGT